MTLFENILGIFVSMVLMGSFTVILIGFYYIWDCKRNDIYDVVMKYAPPKKARPEDDYLVVCPTKKRAMYWRRRILDNIADCYTRDEIKVINNYGKYVCLYFPKTHLVVRFISERDYYEASRGFHGWVVDEAQVEEWVAAAEDLDE